MSTGAHVNFQLSLTSFLTLGRKRKWEGVGNEVTWKEQKQLWRIFNHIFLTLILHWLAVASMLPLSCVDQLLCFRFCTKHITYIVIHSLPNSPMKYTILQLVILWLI